MTAHPQDMDRTWCMSEVDIFRDLDEGEMQAMMASRQRRGQRVANSGRKWAQRLR